jgi:hypothetical protein
MWRLDSVQGDESSLVPVQLHRVALAQRCHLCAGRDVVGSPAPELRRLRQRRLHARQTFISTRRQSDHSWFLATLRQIESAGEALGESSSARALVVATILPQQGPWLALGFRQAPERLLISTMLA